MDHKLCRNVGQSSGCLKGRNHPVRNTGDSITAAGQAERMKIPEEGGEMTPHNRKLKRTGNMQVSGEKQEKAAK